MVLRVRKGPATKSDRRRREGDEICRHTDGQTHTRRFMPRAKIFDNRPPKLYNNFRRSNVCGRPRGEIRRQLHNRERHNGRQATAPGTKIKYRAVGQPPRLPPDRKATRQNSPPAKQMPSATRHGTRNTKYRAAHICNPAGKANAERNPTRNTQYKYHTIRVYATCRGAKRAPVATRYRQTRNTNQNKCRRSRQIKYGRLAERSKAAVLKCA